MSRETTGGLAAVSAKRTFKKGVRAKIHRLRINLFED
jgi:hypothetical protein